MGRSGMAALGEALPPMLRWLILTDNRIDRLPEVLGERPHLQKLMLSGALRRARFARRRFRQECPASSTKPASRALCFERGRLSNSLPHEPARLAPI